MKLWLWKVHPRAGSKCLVCGLAMSWNRAAQRSMILSLLAATASSTPIVCRKLSLWPCPFTTSTPLSRASSGSMICSRPLSWSSRQPVDGRGAAMILKSSSLMRSRARISTRCALRRRASKVSGARVKSSCVAKRTARSIRSGSSLNVMSGSSGVRMMRLSMSDRPS